MFYKDLIIINNEKVYKEKDNYYCDNLDLKVLPEGLNEYHSVEYIVRNAKKKGHQKINLKSIKSASNIFSFIKFIFKSFKKPNADYLLISITPYTFLSFLFLFLFRKKRVFIYLFSSGHEEYKYILGRWFVWIYHIMYIIVTSNAKVIVCHERLYKKKSYLVNISRLDNQWMTNHKDALLDKARFVYVGRMSHEKGIFDFIKIFNNLKFDSEFSIVGEVKNKNFFNKNINLLGYVAEPQALIDIYDNHNIMILPSFTEATPYVVDESLARNRPVIIFEDIAYVVKGRKGIFIAKREIDSFSKTVKHIMDNYTEIQQNMKKNILPTKNSMIKEISDIIKVENF